jgi:hypothetical protein
MQVQEYAPANKQEKDTKMIEASVHISPKRVEREWTDKQFRRKQLIKKHPATKD